jgi:uncharacterized membrane protein (Fun14 family)
MVEGAATGVAMWVKALVVASVALMGIGVATPLVAPKAEAPAKTTTGAPAGGSGVTGLVEDGQTPPATEKDAEPGALTSWSPKIFALGFSFFVGFAVAYALRWFLRLALVGIGFFFLLMFGLQYAGLIEVKWAVMEEKYNRITTRFDEKANSAVDYMGTYLPSAASASAGAFAGFWRRR